MWHILPFLTHVTALAVGSITSSHSKISAICWYHFFVWILIPLDGAVIDGYMGINLWDDIAIYPFWCQITPLTKTRTEILKMLGLPISSSTWYGPISSSTWFGPKASSTCFGLAHIYRVHKKMVHSDFSLKSVPGVRFCFFRGGLEPELCAWTIWAL